MLVKEIMKSPAIVVTESASLREVVALMTSVGVSGLPVVDAVGDLVGIITEHDVIRAVIPTYQDLLSSDTAVLDTNLMLERGYVVRDTPVSSLMTRNVVTVRESDPLVVAASAMIMKRIKRLPVVSGRKPIGIISTVDILHAVMHGGI